MSSVAWSRVRAIASGHGPWLVAAVPIVVACAVAVTGDWLPMGDNAYFSIRAADVGTASHPLLGAWSSGSMSVGVDVNNLGPLQLDLLAVPVRIGWINGTAIGVAATNLAAVVIGVSAARRIGGTIAAVAVAIGATGLAWTLGAQLHEPQQHSAMVLPAYALLVLVWALVAGDIRSLPWAVGVSSLLVQTHFTYLTWVPILSVVGALACWMVWRKEQRGDPVGRRSLVVAVVVAVVCWLQPLIDQLAGRGNLTNVATAAGSGAESAGVGHGARAMAEILAMPPWWFPPSYRDFDPNAVVGGALAMVGLGLVGVVVLATAMATHRSGDHVARAGVVTTAVTLCLALLAASSQVPTGEFGLVAGNYRWLWAVAAWTWVSVAIVVVRAAAERTPTAHAATVRAMASVLVLVAVVAVVPATRADLVASHERQVGVARDLLAQLGPLEELELVEVDRRGMLFGEPFSYVVIAHLQSEGVRFEALLDLDVLRFGTTREPSGDAAGTIRFGNGDDALETRPGEQLVAFATGLDDAERDELARLRSIEDRSPDEADALSSLEWRWRVSTVGVLFRPAGASGSAG